MPLWGSIYALRSICPAGRNNRRKTMNASFYEKLLQLKHDNGLCQEVLCTEDENHLFLEMVKQKKALPEDVVRCEESNGTKLDKFYRVVPLEMTHEEIQEFCMLNQIKHLKTIKNCVVFFTVLTVLSLVATILILLN